MPRDMMVDAPAARDEPAEDDVIIDNRQPAEVRRQQGIAARQELMRRTLETPMSAAERRKLRRHHQQ